VMAFDTRGEAMHGAQVAGYRETLRQLGSAQKAVAGGPAYSRFVNRKLGRYLAAAAYQRGLTPNTVTFISAGFSFVGILLIALGRPSIGFAVGAAAALILGYALDSADGQLARLRGGGSLTGEWLDHMLDVAKLSSLHLAVLICFYRQFHFSSAGPLLIPAGYMVVIAVWFFGIMLVDQLRRREAADTGARRPASAASPLRSLLVLPQDYGLLCVVVLLLFSREAFFVAYTALFAGNVLLTGGSLIVWYREMSGYDRARRARALRAKDAS
jgi:phosphatidylglycerophosphate synthase